MDPTPAKKSSLHHRLISAVLIVAVAILVGVMARGLLIDQTKVPSALLGRPAPAFHVTLLQPGLKEWESRTTIGLDDLKGKRLVLNVFASWCISCRQEAHELERFWQTAKANGWLVVGVAIQDRREDALQFAQSMGKTYPIALDEDGHLSIDYGVNGVPETFLIDELGIIQHKEVGPVTHEMLVSLMDTFHG